MSRIASIDILRAMTMFLMLWVNDFFTLKNVPKWLSHASATEDYLGFSDVIFPLFLFIVGLSIPLAIEFKVKIGKTTFSTFKHIITRSLSLLLIGVFMVNYETAHDASILIGVQYWAFLMALAIVLIWMDWAKSPIPKKWHKILQGIGTLLLFFLAIIYKGGDNGADWMTIQWWGILGLIGWAYLANALMYLFTKGNFYAMVTLLFVFMLLPLLSFSEITPPVNNFFIYFSPIYSGTIPAFTAAGIVATLLFRKLEYLGGKQIFFIFSVIGVLFISYGLLMRPIWGISKIQGTPAWLGICIGIGSLSFAFLYYIADIKKKVNWAKIIAPAGTATLTCYLIPYFVYPLRNITGLRFPDFMNFGFVGLFISLISALLVVLFTGWIEKKGFKLKL
jgi:predicted acyltransferase